MKIKKMFDHKTIRCKYTATSSRERDELGQELHLRSQFAQSFCNLCTVLRPLKQSFYMSRVRRKEDLKTYSRIPRKSYLNSKILKPQQIGGVKQLSSLFSWTDLKASTLDLETWFLELFKHILNLLKYK